MNHIEHFLETQRNAGAEILLRKQGVGVTQQIGHHLWRTWSYSDELVQDFVRVVMKSIERHFPQNYFVIRPSFHL